MIYTHTHNYTYHTYHNHHMASITSYSTCIRTGFPCCLAMGCDRFALGGTTCHLLLTLKEYRSYYRAVCFSTSIINQYEYYYSCSAQRKIIHFGMLSRKASSFFRLASETTMRGWIITPPARVTKTYLYIHSSSTKQQGGNGNSGEGGWMV